MRRFVIIAACVALLCGGATEATAKVTVTNAMSGLEFSWTGATAGEVIGAIAHAVGRPIQAGQAVMDQPVPDFTWRGESAEALLAAILAHADYAAVNAGPAALVTITRLRGWPGSNDLQPAELASAGDTGVSRHTKRPLHLSADIADMGAQAQKVQQQRATQQSNYFLGFTDQKPK